MPTLSDIYSAADSFKRRLSDAASNPSGALSQMLGYANDRARNFNELSRQAADEFVQRGGGFANQGLAGQALGQAYAESASIPATISPIGSKSFDLLRQWVNESPENVAKALGSRIKDDAKKYEIRMMDVGSLKPTQVGEDFINDSSKYTARSIKKASLIKDLNRKEDILPIKVDEAGNILDGNHRYAAALMNEEQYIPVLYPIGKGPSEITNLYSLINK